MLFSGLLYFAKQNETKRNLYFAKLKSVLCEIKICNFMKNFYFPTIMTVTHISQFCCGIERRVLVVLKTQISKNPLFQSLFAVNCFGEISTEHCAFSTTAFGSWWTDFALFCYPMITWIWYLYATHTTRIIQKAALDLFVELIGTLRYHDGTSQDGCRK